MILATEFYMGPIAFILVIVIFSVAYIYYSDKKINGDSSNIKVTSIKGKLIRKSIDKDNGSRNIRNLKRMNYGMAIHEEGSFTKYYITFETEKGIKSFTVSKENYKKVKVGQKGIIKMKRKKFISFQRN